VVQVEEEAVEVEEGEVEVVEEVGATVEGAVEEEEVS
jgi:hypothetical protein